MAVTALYLADKSALARQPHHQVAERLLPRISLGLVATCAVIDLEVLYSARNATEYARTATERSYLPQATIDREVTDRSLEVQSLLAQRGQHRLPIPNLLIAAAAEVNDLVVLHYDTDFDRIADVTGQQTEWVVPKGSIT
ncbi:MAG: PIN domain nuclease [Acidimicrobiia bacterium]|nr:PIN domain nuclease [Actinomycetota bacterium]MBL6924293.1 PIN domain nuclease [Acidimicrobiia bacterium]MBL6926102.1 PIN domain nuclease [Acidimicrobiia bacterium]